MTIKSDDVIEFATQLAKDWTGSGRPIPKLLSSRCTVRVSHSGEMVLFPDFVKSFSPRLITQGFQRDPFDSRISTICEFLSSAFPERVTDSTVVSLEWQNISDVQPRVASQEFSFEGKNFLVSSFQALATADLVYDTVAEPFCCFGRFSKVEDGKYPLDDAFYIVLDLFDGSAFVLITQDN